ncbi:MAG: aromatic ring-hydroxylating dioxygenase subunit alpha [Rhodospirillaceae bacterium]|jgi:phenylpropionate dioxygenase-like ring-hydroxylating dioxygenase large terminal subunit|nr:aromatic ring-hydroxylating dioxygenase subunit alpha [Rhodospirillaceae bacterium]MBT5456375.1 aromatic ring-hydroxylating dioxygenase subunit alpha [Rhodospirillaceae bacterium]
MYLRNRWYVAAWARELDDGPVGRTIMDEPIAFFRAKDGKVAALEDACAHRFMPLSLGTVEDGCLQCPYHGLRYDSAGACVHVPGQTQVPPGARVKSYPVAEKWRYVWIWMGDAAQADEALIPDYHWNDDPEWVSVGDYFYVKGSYRLLIDNLLDLSHVAYVHATTLGTDNVANFPVKVRRDDDKVHVDRWIFDEPAPPMFKLVGGFEGKVDRWQMIQYQEPSHFMIDVGCAVAGSGAPDGDRSQGVEMYSNHTLTPETETSTHYFWHHARNFRLDEDDLTNRLATATKTAFGEDVIIIEMQQDRMDRAPANKPIIDINADAGVLQARRLLDERIEAEQR